jgi:hypothetical protein
MQTTTPQVTQLLKEGLAVKAQPQLIAEWNQNRYAGIASVDNDPPEEEISYDLEHFPVSSIVEPMRPSKKGIAKARAEAMGFVEIISDGVQPARWYTSDVDDPYKYWSSPEASRFMAGSNLFDVDVSPRVVYQNLAWSNKIHVLFETSAAAPESWSVSITEDGTTWTEVWTSSGPDISYEGITLYRQEDGSWEETVYRDNPMQLKGLRIDVFTLDTENRYLDLIEISLRLEVDLTNTLISSNSNFTMSSTSFVTPLGQASSNTATVELSNTDGRYNNTKLGSLFYGIIDKNVKFTYSMGYDTTPVGGSGYTYVREYTMYTDGWNGQGTETAQISLKDASKFLQEMKPPKMYLENMTIGRIVWQLCDVMGFTDYLYDRADDDKATRIPHFWTDGEKTLWEIFSNLALTTQSAIFFDEFGMLQIQTRDVAYNLGKPISWQLDGVKVGTKQPDIIELSQEYDYEANDVTVRYSKTAISDTVGRVPKMDVVWQPEETLVLRSSQLRETMNSTQTFIRMTSSEASVWPYQGIINVEGELMRYDGKGYWYYNLAGVSTFALVKSADQKKNIDENLTKPELLFKSGFSGYMGNVERGIWNTTAAQHLNQVSGYTVGSSKKAVGTPYPWRGGFVHNSQESTVSLKANKTFKVDTFYVAKRQFFSDKDVWYFGTRMRFRGSGYTNGMAGIAFNLGSDNRGYYVELCRTDRLPGGRKYQNEINFYARRNNGTLKRYGPEGGKGVPFAVSANTWYDIDISLRKADGSANPASTSADVISIAVNGSVKMTVTVPSGEREPYTRNVGMFTRGDTHADFEYLWANGTKEDLKLDSGNLFDRIRGEFTSPQDDRKWIWAWDARSRIYRKKYLVHSIMFNQRGFDEFGALCQEAREFEVKFEKFPAVHSNIYFSNTTQIVCPEYSADPFGAKFVLTNVYRSNAILNGEDTLTFGPDNPVEQKLMIYGRTVNKEDEKTVVVKNDNAIRRRGNVETEIHSEWIQSEQSAKDLADWIDHHWSQGADEIEAEIYGNPLLQIGDLVSVNYPQKDFDPVTHRYFIVGIVREYSSGYGTTRLTLRRFKS